MYTYCTMPIDYEKICNEAFTARICWYNRECYSLTIQNREKKTKMKNQWKKRFEWELHSFIPSLTLYTTSFKRVTLLSPYPSSLLGCTLIESGIKMSIFFSIQSIHNEEAMRELDIPNISLQEKMAAFANAGASGLKYYSVIGERSNNLSVSIHYQQAVPSFLSPFSSFPRFSSLNLCSCLRLKCTLFCLHTRVHVRISLLCRG